MAQKDRDKEYWLIPKRANLHQSILLIKGILELKYNLTTWGPSKQDRLGSYLGKKGATDSGKTITPQSIRTLIASIPQYFGFLYINTDTTPNTIVVTDAGKQLVQEHDKEIKPMKNLKDGALKKDLISKSFFYLKQFEKLQITNPIILKDCENIFTFPIYVIYKILLKYKYIDVEELAYIIFKIKDHTEVNLAILQIDSLRKMDFNGRLRLIDEFKNTHLGNISLVQAASTSYLHQLLEQTGIFQRKSIVLENPNNPDESSRKAIFLTEDGRKYVDEYLAEFPSKEVYDFKENLELWISYIGNPNVILTPKDLTFQNKTNESFILNVSLNTKHIFNDLISAYEYVYFPVFKDNVYLLEYINISNGEIYRQESINITDSLFATPTINYTDINNGTVVSYTFETICSSIIEHNESKNFDINYLKYLHILEKITAKDYTSFKSLRGARLEHLFYLLLTNLKEENVIDDIYWNGKLSHYGLPIAAPGGKTGIPDIVFVIDDTHYLLELTTIKAKSMQWTAEANSVPDHINNYKKENEVETVGIYTAPIHHERVTNGISSQLLQEIKINFLTDKELIELFSTKNRDVIIKNLNL